MTNHSLFLSTIDPNAHSLAKQYGLGLEIAQYCTAWNMDDHWEDVHPQVLQQVQGVSHILLHAPYNELFPCAIDPQARALAARRYWQAIALAKTYGAEKVIIHGGYHPKMYYPVWYVGESIRFWQEFLREDPGVEIVLENVLEEAPEMLLDIVSGVDHPKLRLCLDVGHVNAYSSIPVLDWLTKWAPWLSHFHIHNNDGSWDTHSPLDCGTIPMQHLLEQIETRCPQTTLTLELMDSEASLHWLMEEMKWNWNT